MLRPVPITTEIVDRVLEIETENTLDRLRPIAGLPGNPFGVRIARFGRAVAFSARGIRLELYNSVLEIGPDTEAHLDAIAAFYAEEGTEGLLEIAPGRLTPDLGRALRDRGYATTGFHCGLVRAIGPEDAEAPPIAGVEVAAIDPEDPVAFATWVETYASAWQSDPTPPEALATWRAHAPRWRFFLARVEGAPAAAAVLDVRGRAALNASAATKPDLRGRRAQSALIRARIVEAARLGCDLLVGGAYFGTTSMRNHQREGFATAFTRGLWSPARPA